MSAISLEVAKAHLRVDDSNSDAEITSMLAAAESIAQQFLNRRIFADQGALTTAMSGAQATLQAAGIAYDAAILAADAITDERAREIAIESARYTYARAQTTARAIYAGVVMDDLIKAAVLLILGHLYENRQDVQEDGRVAELPMGSVYILQPYRELMGV